MLTKEVLHIKAITVRFSDKLHKALRHHLIDKDVSIQQYIIDLVKKDIQFNDEYDDPSDYAYKKN